MPNGATRTIRSEDIAAESHKLAPLSTMRLRRLLYARRVRQVWKGIELRANAIIHPERHRKIADWPPERSEFELAVPILDNLTTAGCFVRQHFDEPLLGRLEERESQLLVELFRNHH